MNSDWSDEELYRAVVLENLCLPDAIKDSGQSLIDEQTVKDHQQLVIEQPMLQNRERHTEAMENTREPNNFHSAPITAVVTAPVPNTSVTNLKENESTTDQDKALKVTMSSDGDSEDDIPLSKLIKQKPVKREKRKRYTLKEPVHILDIDSSECEVSDDMDKSYILSTSDSEDDISSPVNYKRPRKSVRKRTRTSNKNESIKAICKQKVSVENIKRKESYQLKKAINKSKAESNIQSMLKKFAESRINNLLKSNGLQRQPIYPDGNCFFNAIIQQSNEDMTVTKLRSDLCGHLKEHKEHYIKFLPTCHVKGELPVSEKYDKMLFDLMKDGMWDVDMADLLPLGMANLLKRNLTIYTSNLHNPILNITPDLDISDQLKNSETIKLAYLAIRGTEHYDACISRPRQVPSRKNDSGEMTQTREFVLPTTPVKTTASTSQCATPRKEADYVSPVKIKATRKRSSNVEKWKKSIRKHNKNTGKAYLSASKSKTIIAEKKVQPCDCRRCVFKCNENINEETREMIFQSYYNESMTFERKRDFICQHVEVRSVGKRYKGSRKHESRRFFMPVETKKVRVCKKFFLRTLDIGDKLIRCTLEKKQHGTYSGVDQRGKHTPKNKTAISSRNFVKEHIESFPVVESHYRRKSTSKHFLAQQLSVRKMYDLYQEKCKVDGVSAVSEKVYRDVFCKEYNLSFHKPKKDACQTCHKYKEQKQAGQMSEEGEKRYQEHKYRKEMARIEKENDKKRAKQDKSIFTATFDLQAVLQTPCSNVSQTYYKRKLNSYNLTFYSLSDGKGTCYIWDETHGERGSSEIGTCVLTHIESLPPSVQHVILYSDCCSGQNRNRYLASGLLYSVNKHPNLHTIEQKFLESGHTQMECDSMHSAIEHARKRTSLFVPDQWDTILQMARRYNPYVVIPMRYNNFFDLKAYSKKNFKNFKTATDGTKVNWLQVKVLKVNQEYPDEIMIKYSFEQEEYLHINVKKTLRRKSMDKLPMKYSQKLPISSAKKKDLLDLCKGYIIPQMYWPYYEDLPSNSGIKDRLPCPDILEEEVDTDEEIN